MAGRNELPPEWDGLRVEWRGFELEPVSFDLPADCCASCGGVGPRSINHGRLPGAEVPSHLVAVRCTTCGFTQVRDARRVWWDLDESDYSDKGSVYMKQEELAL
jgi:ribosomal protein L37E